MNSFEALISEFAEKTGLSLQSIKDGGVDLVVDGVDVSVQYRPGNDDCVLFTLPLDDTEPDDRMARRALELSANGAGTGGHLSTRQTPSIVCCTLRTSRTRCARSAASASPPSSCTRRPMRLRPPTILARWTFRWGSTFSTATPRSATSCLPARTSARRMRCSRSTRGLSVPRSRRRRSPRPRGESQGSCGRRVRQGVWNGCRGGEERG